MQSGISYAAALGTSNGNLQQPQVQARSYAQSGQAPSDSHRARDQGKSTARNQRTQQGIRTGHNFGGQVQAKGSSAESNTPQDTEHSNNRRPRSPRHEHVPKTSTPESQVYVLTFKLSDSLSRPMNGLRKQYFPKKLNKLPAHLTLFHALPDSQIDSIKDSLTTLAANTRPFNVSTGDPFRMRRGVGVNVAQGNRALKSVQADLKSQFMDFLSEQDAGGWRPHWTVMNKSDNEEEVESAFGEVSGRLKNEPYQGRAMGLDLWRYEKGRWIWEKGFNFGDTQNE